MVCMTSEFIHEQISIMDYNGLSWTIIVGGRSWLAWMIGMDDWYGWLAQMTGTDDWHGWLAWMTGTDDWHGWLAWMTILYWFYILISYLQTYGHWYLLSRYRDWKWFSTQRSLIFSLSENEPMWLSKLKSYTIQLSYMSVQIFRKCTCAKLAFSTEAVHHFLSAYFDITDMSRWLEP